MHAPTYIQCHKDYYYNYFVKFSAMHICSYISIIITCVEPSLLLREARKASAMKNSSSLRGLLIVVKLKYNIIIIHNI